MLLEGKITKLRRVTEDDAEIMHLWENMPEFWPISLHAGPVSHDDITEFIRLSGNLVSQGQERWLILDCDENEVGFLDLFDYNPEARTAGVGILITHTGDRRKGYASDALFVIEKYCFESRILREIKCLIHDDNIASIELFRRLGYRPEGQSSFKGKNARVFRKKL